MDKKKTILVSLLLAMVVALNPILVNAITVEGSSYYNNKGVTITEKDYTNLVNLGFTDNEIKNMTQEEFDANHNLIGEVVSTTTKYYKNVVAYDINHNVVSTNQYETSSVMPEFSPLKTGYIETNYKKMTTEIIFMINRYRYKVSVEWKSIPNVRSYDIIGVGFDSSKVSIYSDVTFQQNYCYTNGNCESSNLSTIKKSSTGGAAIFMLPTSSSVKTMDSYLYYMVQKTNSGTLTSMEAAGDYSHAVKGTTSKYIDNFTITSRGLYLDAKITDYYDEIPYAEATWTGSW